MFFFKLSLHEDRYWNVSSAMRERELMNLLPTCQALVLLEELNDKSFSTSRRVGWKFVIF